MKRLLKEANVPWDESIITITSDKKTKGNRFFDMVSNGYILIITGIVLLLLMIFLLQVSLGGFFLISFLFLLFGDNIIDGGKSMLTTFNILALIAGTGAIVSIFLGIRQRERKGNWYCILYNDQILFKYQDEGETKEIAVPFSKIKKCLIRPSQKTFNGLSSNGPLIQTQFFVNVHIEYEENDVIQFVNMPLSNRYKELNTIITYLQNEQSIPVYFTYIKVSMEDSYKNLDSTNIEDFHHIHFEGDLDAYM